MHPAAKRRTAHYCARLPALAGGPEEGRLMDEAITYDVRVYKTDVRKGKTTTSYHVRWRAGSKSWKAAFRNRSQADSFRSSLLAAARNGEAFSLTTGRP